MSGQSKIDFVFPLGLQSLSLKYNFYKDFNYLWYINIPDQKKTPALKRENWNTFCSLRQTNRCVFQQICCQLYS